MTEAAGVYPACSQPRHQRADVFAGQAKYWMLLGLPHLRMPWVPAALQHAKSGLQNGTMKVPAVSRHDSPAGGFMASDDALLAERPPASRLVPMPLLE